jgi:hypothetical protein
LAYSPHFLENKKKIKIKLNETIIKKVDGRCK